MINPLTRRTALQLSQLEVRGTDAGAGVLTDPADGKASNQFPGWPVTIHQAENRGANRLH